MALDRCTSLCKSFFSDIAVLNFGTNASLHSPLWAESRGAFFVFDPESWIQSMPAFVQHAVSIPATVWTWARPRSVSRYATFSERGGQTFYRVRATESLISCRYPTTSPFGLSVVLRRAVLDSSLSDVRPSTGLSGAVLIRASAST